MNSRDRLIKLQADIKALIEDFENETGLMVSSRIELNRGGCTDSEPYYIYGIYIPVFVKTTWTSK